MDPRPYLIILAPTPKPLHTRTYPPTYLPTYLPTYIFIPLPIYTQDKVGLLFMVTINMAFMGMAETLQVGR